MFDVSIIDIGMICLSMLLSIGMTIYVMACGVRFVYVRLIKGRSTRFTIIPVTVGLFLILLLVLPPYFWIYWRQTYPLRPPQPMFPDSSAFADYKSYMSNEDVTSFAVMGVLVWAITAALLVGLPVDLFRNRKKRQIQLAISASPQAYE